MEQFYTAATKANEISGRDDVERGMEEEEKIENGKNANGFHISTCNMYAIHAIESGEREVRAKRNRK